MQIVNLSKAAMVFLAEAVTRAEREGRRFRLSFGRDDKGNYFTYKVGEGMWSPPFYDQIDDDPHRDTPSRRCRCPKGCCGHNKA